MSTKAITFSLLAALSLLTAGCGNVNQGRSPSVVAITLLEAASGGAPDKFGGTLFSDVVTIVKRDSVNSPTVFNDLGRVTMSLALKNQNVGDPSPLDTVTFTHYRISYHRTDNHNIEGVDIPYGFDSGLTFTVPTSGTVQVGFEIVRHNAKEDAPLVALVNSGAIISTITDITFYGKDQAGNNVQVTGSIGVNFGDFGDPTT